MVRQIKQVRVMILIKGKMCAALYIVSNEFVFSLQNELRRLPEKRRTNICQNLSIILWYWISLLSEQKQNAYLHFKTPVEFLVSMNSGNQHV